MLNHDAVHTQSNGLIDHVGLQGRILTRIEDTQVNAKRFGLTFDTGQIGLEEVTG